MISMNGFRGAAFGAAALVAGAAGSAQAVTVTPSDFDVETLITASNVSGANVGDTIGFSAKNLTLDNVLLASNRRAWFVESGVLGVSINGVNVGDAATGGAFIYRDGGGTADFLTYSSTSSTVNVGGEALDNFSWVVLLPNIRNVATVTFDEIIAAITDEQVFSGISLDRSTGSANISADGSVNVSVQTVPVPAGIFLLPVGVAALVLAGRRKAGNGDALADVNAAYEGAQDGAVAQSFNKAVIVIVQSGKVNLGAFATNVVYADLDAIPGMEFVSPEKKVEGAPGAAAPALAVA